LLAATNAPLESGPIYNVGTGVQTTLEEVVEVTRRVLAVKAEPDWGTMKSRGWDTHLWIADAGRITRELGWAPRHSFEQGFKRLVEWFRANPGLWSFYDDLHA
jgi:nucleoside-diphosphate-sugar epimerase